MAKYKKDTKNYIDAVRNTLMQKYGEIKPEWEVIVTLLADNIELYRECVKSIAENGIYDKSRGIKNPLLSTVKDIQVTILKYTQKLGITPWDASKIKAVEDESTDDYIAMLTGEVED